MADDKRGAKTPFHNPFASLKDKLGPLPPGPTPKEVPRRAVIAYERKGHGGKECTRITHFALHADEAVELCKQLKQRLGCGGSSEGCDIVLQGDQRERLRGVLPSLGVQRITVA